MEDYKEKYEQALEWARKVIQGKIGFVLDDVLNKFPELKESEDERIRKNIISWLKNIEGQTIPINDYNSAIAWLEKQVGQKPSVEPCIKIEEGKWYVCISQFCNCIEGRVYKASSDSRIIDDFGTEYNMHSDAYKYFRLWTIKDAKDGDVLTTDTWTFIFKKYQYKSVYYHCAFSTFNNFSISDTGEFDSDYVHPATKEQRDLLFYKMYEAGYEWNAEKKKLKKIKQKPTEIPLTLDEAIAQLQKERVQPQNLIVTDEELIKARKEAYDDALNKIEYHSGTPTFNDGWSAAIWYLKKKNAQP